MKLIRTVKLKLNVAPQEMLPTLKAYTHAYNFVCTHGWEENEFNSVNLHKDTYYQVREDFSLPSQLAISSRMKASESLKGVLQKKRKKLKVTKPQSKQCSIRYDANSFTLWFDRNEVSILTLEGRKKFELNIPEYFQQYVSWKRKSAELFVRKNMVFLNIVFEKDVEDVETSETPFILGVDRGVNKLAVTSDNKFYNGKIRRQVNKYRKLRKQLQKCGSKSAKRHLKRLSLQENRFRSDVNHSLAKQIVESLPSGSIIVLEDLKYIRERCKQRKKERRNFHNWSFFQFEEFLKYKAEAKGIKVEYVDARYTSQKCSCCKHISKGNRKYQSLHQCESCGFTLNADLNAARNIELNYRDAKGYPYWLSVNQPNVVTTKHRN